MSIEFKIDFYNIGSCGFYEKGSSNPSFGDFRTLLDDFGSFLGGRNLALTKTYDYNDFSGELPTYCYDFLGEDDRLLITWNESANEDGNVSSVNGNDSVGSAHVELTSVPENHIPGYATYFWMIPSENVIASLRPVGVAYNGHQNLKRYLSSFLKLFTRYNVNIEQDGAIIGYSNTGNIVRKVYPRFESFLKTRMTDRDYLISAREEIYKIIQKDKINLTSDVKVGLVESIINAFLLNNIDLRVLEEKSYRVELDISLTENQLIQIIDGFETGFHDNNSDVGFMLHGNQTPIWLSKTYEKHEYILNVERELGGVINGAELYRELMSHRNNILSYLEVERR